MGADQQETTPNPIRNDEDEGTPVWLDNAMSTLGVAFVIFVLAAVALLTYQMMSDPSAPSGVLYEVLQMGMTVGIGGACFYGIYRSACWLKREWRQPGS